MNNVIVEDSAIARIREIKQDNKNHEKFLRVSISGGGCSGFQYIFELDNKNLEGDIKIAQDGAELLAVTDETSMEFLNGASIQFVKELGASYFKVINPNAKASCGCGSSFNV